MTDPQTIKVYDGLKSVERDKVYHLGHYEVDFPDGALTFQLLARICPDPHCPCDNFQIDIANEGGTFRTWFHADRGWKDLDQKPLAPEMVNVFQIIEKTPRFKERYLHMVFLRRIQVLDERHYDPNEMSIPPALAEGGDPSKGILSRVRLAGKTTSLPYSIQFCGDLECFCEDLFLELKEKRKEYAFRIDTEDVWHTVEDSPASLPKMSQAERSLMKSEKFREQLALFRTERQLNNYYRFAARYRHEKNLNW